MDRLKVFTFAIVVVCYMSESVNCRKSLDDLKGAAKKIEQTNIMIRQVAEKYKDSLDGNHDAYQKILDMRHGSNYLTLFPKEFSQMYETDFVENFLRIAVEKHWFQKNLFNATGIHIPNEESIPDDIDYNRAMYERRELLKPVMIKELQHHYNNSELLLNFV
ncbi:uncharacterized protein LOC126899172 [Daktulosphaira vitifoliae]|uniref:uncharacterized protein LOC126899172 n=1 Tax=Daktulosphaira vitifoliae TaxID=58002 RepID=UPI0021A9CEA1|nr:uncharacterized protein LOC126899172 [Daktulosphaira vitifoliae]XP_050529732.1 uncharacterized protein LOC126899172 [Daktulosphaira vitifoliae]